MKPPISTPILLNLRCGHCRKFLTCGPTHVTPDSSILCGRCQRFSKPIYPNKAFEAIASMYSYPCLYWPKHCNKVLTWNQALEHEYDCIFQSGCNIFCTRPGTFFKSERKFAEDAETTLEHITDAVLEQLKCFNCNLYLSNGPIHIVVDGRNICHRCSYQTGVPKDAIRNLSYETIASGAIFPCIYRMRGCTFRLKFGRDLWAHEGECSYGQIQQNRIKKNSKVGKDGKEKGVIATHSGHYYGTITPHSALFAPPTTSNNNDGKILTQELTEMMKKKNEEIKNFDSQSVDSIMSRASTFDSLPDIISRDNVSRSTFDNISRDNISRSTVDNISNDNISTDSFYRDNISRDNISRSSSMLPTPTKYLQSTDAVSQESYRPSLNSYLSVPASPSFDPYRNLRIGNDSSPGGFGEVAPLPTPTGYNKISYNGYYQNNINSYDMNHLYHYPPIYEPNNLQHSSSFNYPAPPMPFVQPKRAESFRVGNIDIINELKEKHRKQSNNSKIVQDAI